MSKLGGHSTWFVFELELLKEHVDAIENLLEKEAAENKGRIDAYASKITDEDERDSYYEWASDDVWKLEDRFPSMQRESNLISVMSFAEIQLNKLCDRVASKKGYQIKVGDLSGRGIERAKNYMSKVAAIQTPWGTSTWQELKRAAEIRNDLVHNDGIIQKVDIKTYIQGSGASNLGLDNVSGQVVIKRTYVAHVLKEINELFKQLFTELGESTTFSPQF